MAKLIITQRKVTEKETDIAWRFGSAGGQCDTQLPLL